MEYVWQISYPLANGVTLGNYFTSMERTGRDQMDHGRDHGKASFGGTAFPTNVTLGNCLPSVSCVVKWNMIEWLAYGYLTHSC